MGSEYRTYLAANILNEDRVITYRLLSRALKVHVNTAKEMLFEFHRQQNGKKPGTVHATYLVAGTKYVDNTNPHTEKDGEDEHMRSSPFRSSPLQPSQEAVEDTPILFLTLVGEDELENLRSLYETITSIHVYSLGPHPLKDLQIVSDANREIVDKYSDQDPLEVAALYGAIINKEVRRRKGRRPPPPSSQIAVLPKAPIPKSKIAEVKEESRVPTSSISSSTNTDSKSSQSSAAKDFFGKGTAKKETPTGSGDRRTPAPKRDPSNIFKSFAKAKPKLQREGTDSSAAASIVESPAPSGPEDEPMRDVSDDEEDEYIVPEPASKQVTETDRKSRKEREQALKKMMEDADEEELTTPAEIEESEPEPEISKDSPAGQPSEVVEISGGRRRGRRRVMKKKTFRDEEGYLVTREEPAWESFSEDEPVVTKAKALSSSFSSSAGKGKKSTAKAGQGNIMSFFGKPK